MKLNRSKSISILMYVQNIDRMNVCRRWWWWHVSCVINYIVGLICVYCWVDCIYDIRSFGSVDCLREKKKKEDRFSYSPTSLLSSIEYTSWKKGHKWWVYFLYTYKDLILDYSNLFEFIFSIIHVNIYERLILVLMNS